MTYASLFAAVVALALALPANGQDGTGMLYRRNRYYDPAAGRFTQEDPLGLAGGLNLYGFANGDPVNFSDPFGLCTAADGWKDCDRMITSAQGIQVAMAAKASGEWVYSQGQSGEAGVDYANSVGDCTDYVRNAVQVGLGTKLNKANTRAFREGKAEGFTQVEGSDAQPGDVVVAGGHAGIFTGVNAKGQVRALADNGSPTSSPEGYKDSDTGVTTFKGPVRFFRPLSPANK